MNFYSIKSKAEKLMVAFTNIVPNSATAISRENEVTWTTVCYGTMVAMIIHKMLNFGYFQC